MDIVLYGRIQEGASRDVRARLKAAGSGEVHVRINSPGGSVLEGLAIHSLLASHAGRVVVHIDGYALSMASAVAMAGREIEIAENGWIMLHDPLAAVDGTADELRSTAALLDKSRDQLVNIYATRSGHTAEQIAAMMKQETWFTAAEAVKAGFADRVVAARRMAAAFDLTTAGFTRLPQTLKDQTMDTSAIAEIRAACPGAPADFLLQQIEAGASPADAKAAWLGEREKRCLEREAKLSASIGVKGLVTSEGRGVRAGDMGDAAASFAAAVAEKMKSGTPRLQAVAEVGRAHPDWHEAFVSEHNPDTARVQNLIAERFAL